MLPFVGFLFMIGGITCLGLTENIPFDRTAETFLLKSTPFWMYGAGFACLAVWISQPGVGLY